MIKKLLLIIAVFAAFGAGLLTSKVATKVDAQAAATCPDGDGWTKVDSNDLSQYPVSGATEYCFKAGSESSQGCNGGIFDSWPQPEGTCGLSHWSYYIPESCEETKTCPTECGYAGGTVEGDCGSIKCDATESCPVEEKYIGVFVECVQPGDGSYGAVFGYKNDNEGSIDLVKSYFTPSLSVNPPTTLESGRHLLPTVNVPFWANLVWTIKTPAGKTKTTTASPTYQKICEPETKYHYECVRYQCMQVEGEGENSCNVEDPDACEPQSTPTPTPTPSPTPTPGPGRVSGSWIQSRCEGKIDARMNLYENGVGIADVTVHFEYMNEKKEVKTNSNGEANVGYDFRGEGKITMTADGWPGQDPTVKAAENCETTGEVLGATTGSVLGASTMAGTGTFDEALMNFFGISGSLFALLGVKKYGKKS